MYKNTLKDTKPRPKKKYKTISLYTVCVIQISFLINFASHFIRNILFHELKAKYFLVEKLP
jgi:hypothetical protein